jgi:hypothetical protein
LGAAREAMITMAMLRALCFASLTVLSLSAAGCKDITNDAEAIADRACACKDKTCSDKAIDDLVDLFKNNKHAASDEARMTKVGKRIGQCAITAGTTADDLLAKLKPYDDQQ